MLLQPVSIFPPSPCLSCVFVFTHSLNQTYACENSMINNKLLKEELDFQGFVVSDCTDSSSPELRTS